MKRDNKVIELQDLVGGFLFSLQAEGRARRTHEYYDKLLRHFLYYARSQGWSDRVDYLDAKRIREFLSWIGSRSFEYVAGNGSRRFTKSKPSTAWPYYKALRRLFNWSVEEGFLEESPVKDIYFKAPPLPPVQPYDPGELKRFLAICELDIRAGACFPGLRNKAMLLLFIDSGLHLSEQVHLKLGDLNLEQRCVRVIGKRNKIGICPFSAKTAKAYALVFFAISKEDLIRIGHKSPIAFIRTLKKGWVNKFIVVLKLFYPDAKTNVSEAENIINLKKTQKELAKLPESGIQEFLDLDEKIREALTSDETQNLINSQIGILLSSLKGLLPGVNTEEIMKSFRTNFSFDIACSFGGLYILSVVTYPHWEFTRYPDKEMKPSDYFQTWASSNVWVEYSRRLRTRLRFSKKPSG